MFVGLVLQNAFPLLLMQRGGCIIASCIKNECNIGSERENKLEFLQEQKRSLSAAFRITETTEYSKAMQRTTQVEHE